MRMLALCLLLLGRLMPATWAAAHTEVELVNLSPKVEAGQVVRVGLKFKCEPNYHIYWKNVGDAGTPPNINWKENPNIKFGNTFWPGPHLYDQKGVINFVYSDETIIIIEAKVSSTAKNQIQLKGLAEWLECNESGCFPQEKQVSLVLHIGDKNKVTEIDSKVYADLNPVVTATARVEDEHLILDIPHNLGLKGFFPERPFISATRVAMGLYLPNHVKFNLHDAPEPLTAGPISFVAQNAQGKFIKVNVKLNTEEVRPVSEPTKSSNESLIWQPWSIEAQTKALNKDKYVYLDFTARWCATCQVNKRVYNDDEVIKIFNKNNIVLLRADWTKKDAIISAELKKYNREGIPLNVILKNNHDPIILSEALTTKEVISGIEAAVLNQPYKRSESSHPFWVWLLLAMGGGFILNLMPCVFPMIGIKILGFVNDTGAKNKTILLHGLLYTLGVVVSFISLSILILILKNTGSAVGWGFQMQSASFVLATTVLMVIMGWSFMGLFEIGSSFAGTVAQSDKSSGSWGAFLSGVLATAVATPCTAPGLGAAIGFALDSQRTNLETVSLFIAMGVGMASPYLFLSIFPKLTRFLPKPGEWMETLKKVLALPLFAYAAYLLWVLNGITTNADWIRDIYIGLILVSFSCYVFGKWGAVHQTDKTRKIAGWTSAILLGATLIYLFSQIPN
jgi:thiol:disulfide interchange protein